jgi:hypothetical protein
MKTSSYGLNSKTAKTSLRWLPLGTWISKFWVRGWPKRLRDFSFLALKAEPVSEVQILRTHSKKNHLDLNTEPVSDSLQLTCVHWTQAPVFNFPFFENFYWSIIIKRRGIELTTSRLQVHTAMVSVEGWLFPTLHTVTLFTNIV